MLKLNIVTYYEELVTGGHEVCGEGMDEAREGISYLGVLRLIHSTFS